jgi:allantoinase
LPRRRFYLILTACGKLNLQNTNALILFHAELEKPHLGDKCEDVSYAAFLESRPPAFELDALDLILRLARRYPHLRFHIVHLSTAEAIPKIREARQSGVRNLTVETCFHYLSLRAEDIVKDATEYKCCPPIRGEINRQALLRAILDGDIDYVVSDHSPCTADLKKGNFFDAWGGISSLGLGLPLLWTELKGQIELGRLTDLLATNQAKQLGFEGRKGAIIAGADADFVIFDPEALVSLNTVSID